MAKFDHNCHTLCKAVQYTQQKALAANSNFAVPRILFQWTEHSMGLLVSFITVVLVKKFNLVTHSSDSRVIPK